MSLVLGAEVSCPNIFSIACQKNRVVLPECDMFLPENGLLKYPGVGGGGGGGVQPQSAFRIQW